MTGAQTLMARAALGTTLGGVSLLLANSRRLLVESERQFDRFFLGTFAASRLAVFALLFLVLHVVARGDIPAFYITQAEAVLRHQIPYLDFRSSYAPLHPYFDGIFAALWHSSYAIILSSIAIEILALPVWLRVARSVAPERTVRIAMLLYLASPLSLQYVAVDGQDNVVIAALLGCSAYLIVKHREFVSGLLAGLSIAMVKFLPLLFVPVFFLCAPRRWRWLAGAVAIPAVVYGGFLLLGAPILQPLAEEGAMRSCGDLSYVVEALLGVTVPAPAIDLLVLVVLCGILLLVARASREVQGAAQSRLLLQGVLALSLALMLFAKKSWPAYLMLCLVPLCLLIAGGMRRAAAWRLPGFVLFELVAVTEHSIWASDFLQIDSQGLHQLMARHHPEAIFFFCVEGLLMAGYGWLLFEAVNGIRLAGMAEARPSAS